MPARVRETKGLIAQDERVIADTLIQIVLESQGKIRVPDYFGSASVYASARTSMHVMLSCPPAILAASTSWAASASSGISPFKRVSMV